MSILSSAPGLMVDSKVLQYHQKERGRQSFDSDAWQISTYFNRNSPTLAARCVPFFKRYLLVICHIAAENGLFSFMICLLKRVFFHGFSIIILKYQRVSAAALRTMKSLNQVMFDYQDVGSGLASCSPRSSGPFLGG